MLQPRFMKGNVHYNHQILVNVDDPTSLLVQFLNNPLSMHVEHRLTGKYYNLVTRPRGFSEDSNENRQKWRLNKQTSTIKLTLHTGVTKGMQKKSRQIYHLPKEDVRSGRVGKKNTIKTKEQSRRKNSDTKMAILVRFYCCDRNWLCRSPSGMLAVTRFTGRIFNLEGQRTTQEFEEHPIFNSKMIFFHESKHNILYKPNHFFQKHFTFHLDIFFIFKNTQTKKFKTSLFWRQFFNKFHLRSNFTAQFSGFSRRFPGFHWAGSTIQYQNSLFAQIYSFFLYLFQCFFNTQFF